MNCKNCNSNRIMNIFAHSKDMGTFTYDNLDICHDGYFPEIDGICFSDDADIDICLECGMIQAEFPITDEYIANAVKPDDDDWEDDEDNYEPQKPKTYEVEWLSGDSEIFNSGGEIFKTQRVKSLKERPHFGQFMVTTDPAKGRMLIVCFFNKQTDEISFSGIAYIEEDYLNEYEEISWSDYNELRRL